MEKLKDQKIAKEYENLIHHALKDIIEILHVYYVDEEVEKNGTE